MTWRRLIDYSTMKGGKTAGDALLPISGARDLNSRRVIGWAVRVDMKRILTIRVLEMAVALQSTPSGCVFHCDRGSQYCSHDYQKTLV
jgi:transposase InsO family protein